MDDGHFTSGKRLLKIHSGSFSRLEGIVAAIIAVALGVAICASFNRGIDLTDEGHYLNSIAFPQLYPYTISQFGVILRPLFLSLGESIVLMRLAGYIGLFGLTTALGWRIMRYSEVGRELSILDQLILLIALSASADLFYCIWLPTPNYNLLNLWGALLLACGLASKGISKSNFVVDVILAGLGLALCGLSKPTTAVMLVPLVVLARLHPTRNSALFILLTGALSAAVVTAVLLCVDGSPSEILRRYKIGVELTQILAHNASSMFFRSLPFPAEAEFALCISALFALIYLSSAAFPNRKPIGFATWLIALAGVIGLTIWVQFIPDTWNRPANWTGLIFGLTVFGLAILRTPNAIEWSSVRIAIVLMLVPFAVGFGSNTGLTRSAAQAAPIWSLSAVLWISATTTGQLQARLLSRFVLINSAACAIVITWAQWEPQRQPMPLWTQNQWITIRGQEHSLLVDPATASYFRELAKIANTGGFVTGTPVIDLTGTSPATIFVLGGAPIGAPYMSGGWPGSADYAERSLESVPISDLGRAWILMTPSDPNSIPVSVLSNLGLSFPKNYVEVGRVTIGFMHQLQVLLRPADL